MLARLGLIALLAACGGRPQPSAPEASRDERLTWGSLAPHGDDWREKVATIPVERRGAMAIAILDHGHFDCPGAAEPKPDDDLSSPCLRLALAHWAIEVVPAPLLATRLPLILLRLRLIPDLAVAVFEKALPSLGRHERVTSLMMLESIDEALVDRVAADLPSEIDRKQLACESNDGAVISLLEHGALFTEPWLECSLAHLRRETRIAIVKAAVAQNAEKALGRTRIAEGDCAVLEAYGEPRPSPSSSWHDAMCIGLIRGEDIRDLVNPDGLVVSYESRELNYTRRYPNDDAFELPFADELLFAFPDCQSDTSCKVPGTSVTFSFELDAEHRIFALDRVERD